MASPTELNCETSRYLLDRLSDEKEHGISGGIYNKLQVDMAYNSNHIEGSGLTHDQTRYIYETHTLDAENVKVDDVVETVNHFRCFDFIIDHVEEPVTEDMIKELHRMLKSGTFSAQSKEAVVGDYKKYPNYVGDLKTAKVVLFLKKICKLMLNIKSSCRYCNKNLLYSEKSKLLLQGITLRLQM